MIKDLEQFKKILKICKQNGVETLSISENSIHFALRLEENKSTKGRKSAINVENNEFNPGKIEIPESLLKEEKEQLGPLTQEQLLMWSVANEN